MSSATYVSSGLDVLARVELESSRSPFRA